MRTAMLVTTALLLACTPSYAPSPVSTAATVAAAVLTATAPTATPPAAMPPPEGAAVFRAFLDAVNRGDATAARALLAANATWERGGQCPPGRCAGQARLGEEIDRDVANHHRLEIVQLDVSGPTVTARVELRTEGTRTAGVERVIQLFVVTVADAKITALRAENDLDDPQTAAFAGPRGGRQ